jgi:hypothetical protein
VLAPVRHFHPLCLQLTGDNDKLKAQLAASKAEIEALRAQLAGVSNIF